MELQLLFGLHDLCEGGGEGVVTAQVLDIKQHEDYGPFGFQNDICLINHETVQFGE